ncbi:hypothetical protein [Nocardioides glacieisoli]|uniref:hypothetical protein n=1 Tax=Nocardioides glacieisoli TaxID=1168730 RepID=UPI0013EBD932|nr:hypothetical protein [Nocardioides glacieisoli]
MNSSIRTPHHRPTARAPRLLAAAFLCVGAVGVVAGPAYADSDQVCGPLTSGKIDTSGDPETVTITLSDADIAAGKVITGYCVKAGSAQQADGGPVYVTLDPPVTTITFGHPTGKDVSHYSYSVGVTTTPTTPTPETPTTTTPTEETPTTTTPTPETPTATTPIPETPTPTPTPDVLGEQATAPTGTSNQPQAQAQPQAQVQPQAQAQPQVKPRSPQALPTAVNAGASADAPVSGTESLLAMLLVLLGAVSARTGWIRARG